ncbi:MAG: hypothetical protein ACRDJ9_27770, partial [Dehalococcoidia bacterium]
RQWADSDGRQQPASFPWPKGSPHLVPPARRGRRPEAVRGRPRLHASVNLDMIRGNQHVLTPGRYVESEAAAVEGDDEPLAEKGTPLAPEVRAGFARRAELPSNVLTALDSLGPAGV